MIIYVDIDETICTTPENWGKPSMEKNIDYTLSEPIMDRIEKINKLYDEGNTIIYWTARGSGTGKMWENMTYKQLYLWGCKYHELKMGKPVYDIFIDDKNINSEDIFSPMTKWISDDNSGKEFRPVTDSVKSQFKSKYKWIFDDK